MAVDNPRRKKAAKKRDDLAEKIRKSAFEKQFSSGSKETKADTQAPQEATQKATPTPAQQSEPAKNETVSGQSSPSVATDTSVEPRPDSKPQQGRGEANEKASQNKAPQQIEESIQPDVSSKPSKARQKAKKRKKSDKSDIKTLGVERSLADAALIAAKLQGTGLRELTTAALEKHISSLVKKGEIPDLPQFHF